MRWQIMQSPDQGFIFAVAIKQGWGENKVQVKKVWENEKWYWAIEPYEEDCKCPSLVPYKEEYASIYKGKETVEKRRLEK